MAAGYYGISPRELLFVGDDPLNDISGALRFGCQVCWQTQYRKTERELRALPHVMISHIRELIDLLL
ncbi:MAG: HAD family hydrolase [Succinimonas sp.]|nr:HAD family hydrolase [Succinimonas sp.]